MPRRFVKPYRLEVEAERQPFDENAARRLRRLARERAPSELATWHEAASPIDKFYAAPDAAMAAVALSDGDLARRIALEALDLAPQFPDNWNHGNAIHWAYTALGLLAINEGQIPEAVEQLRLSGATVGSPQLASFGPSMLVARQLLLHGQSAAVLDYFRQCRSFWRMGESWLDIWERKVARGVVPNFPMHLR